MSLKTCRKCRKKKPATTEFFGIEKRLKDGLDSRCRECLREYNREYQRTEKRKIANRRYYQTVNGHLRCIFSGIQQRCDNHKCHAYHNYGGRGIKNRFKSPDEFVGYVVNELKADPRGLQVDRIDNDGHYEPGNIRFVTCKVNSNNRRSLQEINYEEKL